MDTFFMLFIMTRIKERGWPKRKGLRRLAVVDEGAIAQAAGEAVRVALAMGMHMPDFTMRLILQTFDTNQETADLWLDDIASRGDDKIQALPHIWPIWKRFVSHTVSGPDARYSDREVLLWDMTPGRDILEWNSDLSLSAIDQAVNLTLIALGWAFRHPTEVIDTFHDAPPRSDKAKDQVQGIADASTHMAVAEQLIKGWEQDPISKNVGGGGHIPRPD